MSNSDDALAILHVSRPLRRTQYHLLRAWEQPVVERFARGLTLVAAALFFLSAAGTVQIVYTIRISYGLLVLACVIGAPWLLRGWRSVASSLQLSALALLV